MQEFLSAFKERLNIELTPAGVWELDTHNKKQAIDAQRPNHTPRWEDFPNDNMAKHFLTQKAGIVVVDIDNEPITHDTQTGTHYIPSLNITLPKTFYTTTTASNKHHFYYTTTHQTPSRLTHIKNTNVDFFSHGNIFEWHSFSPHNKIHPHVPAELPAALLTLLLDCQPVVTPATEILPTSNIQRYNLIKMFLDNELRSNSQWFMFFKAIFPAKAKPKHKKKLSIEDYPLTYSLFNDIAVKLTATAELGFHEHTLPALRKILQMYKIDPDSALSQRLLNKNILPSLPQHEPLSRYSTEDDTLTFQQHLDAQTQTTTPVFRLIDGTRRFIEINKITQEPVLHNGSYFFDLQSAQALHPERKIVSEEGKVVGWDDNVGIVAVINDPYKPQYLLDPDTQRHTVNLAIKSTYIKQAQATTTIPEENIVYKTLLSGVGPRYLPYVLNFHAQVLFGQTSLNMVLWMASLPTDLGGAGKSIASVEILSALAGGTVQTINEKTAMSGWGDTVTGSRLISMEDMTDLGAREWGQIYAMIKQYTSNAYRKLNMKGGSVMTARVDISISGSSNHRPMLPASDRRFLCLEPAHLRGETEPLSKADSKEIGRVLRSRDEEPALQEYINYLLGIYTQPMEDSMYEALFERTPQTEYRARWVGDSSTNSQNIINTISNARDLYDLLKIDTEIGNEEVIELFRMVVLAYNEDTKKTAVSWRWFRMLLPYVMSDKHKDSNYSKHSIQRMLQVDLKNVGKYADSWKHLRGEFAGWPCEGYVFPLTAQQYQEYIDLIREHSV